MPAGALLLVLVSAFVHASWNALLKRSRDPESGIVGMMAFGGALAVVSALLLRPPLPPPRAALWSFVSGLLETGYFITLARGLARAPLGLVYTVARGGALLVVWPISIVFLHEPMTVSRGAGTALVLVGLGATSLDAGKAPRKKGSETGAGGKPAMRDGLVFAGLAALFIGAFNLSYKMALEAGGSAPAVNAISLATGGILNLAIQSRRGGRGLGIVKNEPVLTLLGGILATGGFLLFLVAMKDTGAGLVLTLRNTSILFAQVLSFALGERPKRAGVVGAALVTAGAVLLAR
jgi:drug/metabolite transporter (DMT)-like permease